MLKLWVLLKIRDFVAQASLPAFVNVAGWKPALLLVIMNRSALLWINRLKLLRNPPRVNASA